MKYFSIILLLLGMFVLGCAEINAQHSTPPPEPVNDKFAARYPKHAEKASWEQTSDGYKATFNDKGRHTVSRFSEEGDWLGTTTKIQKKDWEPSMRYYLDQTRPGYKYLQGYRFDDAKRTRFQIDIQDVSGNRYRLNFDQSGSYLNEAPIEE